MSVHRKTNLMPPKAFTLIELLIVVAIIAILAAIAVPNFLEAQTRSKVSRIKSDMRTVAIALDMYGIDQNSKYPPKWGFDGTGIPYFPMLLTTPIAYLNTGSIYDILRKRNDGDSPETRVFMYTNYMSAEWDDWMKSYPASDSRRHSFCVSSWGPDQNYNWIDWCGPYGMVQITLPRPLAGAPCIPIYDPSNGTVSIGDIPRYGP